MPKSPRLAFDFLASRNKATSKNMNTNTNTDTSSNIEAIAARAVQLGGLMSHGRACVAACAEYEVPRADLGNVASVVSAIVNDWAINGRPLKK